MENLLWLADILKLVQSKTVKNDKNELSLGWLLKNLNKLVYIEVSKHPQYYTVVITIYLFLKIFLFLSNLFLGAALLICTITFYLYFCYSLIDWLDFLNVVIILKIVDFLTDYQIYLLNLIIWLLSKMCKSKIKVSLLLN